MLAAIIANLQNVPQPQPAARLPTVKIDRGGGGGPIWPQAELIDIVAALASFREIPGEHAPVRALRRYKHIYEALPKIKEAREKREAAAFLAGATIADAAAEDRHAAADAARAAMDKLKIEQLVEIIDSVRAEAPVPLRRGPPMPAAGTNNGIGLFVGGLLVGGLLVGIALRSRSRRALI